MASDVVEAPDATAAGDEIALAQALPWVCRDAIAPRIWREEEAAGTADLWVESNGSPGCYGGWELRFPVAAQPRQDFVLEIEAAGDALTRGPDALVAEAFWYDATGKQLDWDPVLLDRAARAGGDSHVRARYAKRLRYPAGATELGVRCGIRWTARGRARWWGWRLRRAPARAARTLRLGVASRPPDTQTDLDGNIAHWVAQCRLASEMGIDLVTLPETILSYGAGRGPDEIHSVAVPLPGPWLEPFQDVARANQMGICFSVHERAGEAGEVVHNTALLLGRNGEVIGTYRKVHLAVWEARWGVTPGHEFPVYEFGGAQVGMAICMDSAAAESARILAQRGAEVMLMPIMSDFRATPWDFTQTWRPDRWQLIQRAHAFDNYLYCVVARNWHTGSAITAPWGDLLAYNEGDRDLIWADVNVDDWRQHPLGTSVQAVLWAMRRPAIYGSLADAYQPAGPPAQRR